MEIDKKEVGQRIRRIRKSLNLSMEKFGQLIGGLPRSTVNNWERGINLPKKETVDRIAQAGYVTNEYLLYGDQENQYIIDMLKKKAGETNPMIEQLIIGEVKKPNITDEKTLNRMLDFYAANLNPPTEQDIFTFQPMNAAENIYTGFTHFGKQAQLFLHQDEKNEILHIMLATFSTFSMDRLLVYLTNKESLPYFAQKLDRKMLKKPIILYSISTDSDKMKLPPLTYSTKTNAYQIAEDFTIIKDKLYLPFFQEVEKAQLFNEKYQLQQSDE